MSTEETKVTTNEVVEEVVKAPTVNQDGTDNKGDEVPVKEDKSKEVNEQILEFLKKQSDTIEKQSKIIEELTKANEEIHKKVGQVENRVDKHTPTVIGSYDFDSEIKALNKSDLQAYETKAKETLDYISTQFNIN